MPEEGNLVSLLVMQHRGCQKPMMHQTKETTAQAHESMEVKKSDSTTTPWHFTPLLPCRYTANQLAPTFGLALLSRQIRTITAIDPGRVTIHIQVRQQLIQRTQSVVAEGTEQCDPPLPSIGHALLKHSLNPISREAQIRPSPLKTCVYFASIPVTM